MGGHLGWDVTYISENLETYIHWLNYDTGRKKTYLKAIMWFDFEIMSVQVHQIL